jgi:hypothetical protein
MQYLTVTTPDNIEIEYRLAGAGSRLAAAVIDILIQTLVFTLFALPTIYIFSSKLYGKTKLRTVIGTDCIRLIK